MRILRVLVSIILVFIGLIFFFVFMIYEDVAHGGPGLCQELTRDYEGPLANVTTPDGKYHAYVFLGACGFMGSDLVTLAYIDRPWKFYPLNILNLSEAPHVDLQWQDNHTLIVQVSGADEPLPADKIIDGISIKYEPTRKVSSVKL